MRQPNPPRFDRVVAAHGLRDAHAECGPRRGELIDWAHAAMPDRRQPTRLKVEDLLASGDVIEADTLLAQVLLVNPTDPTFTRLRAETLLRRGEVTRAQREIELALRGRPQHIATRLLAAEIALAQRDPGRAIEHLKSARAARPWCREVTRRLAAAHLAAGASASARAVIATIVPPDPLLEARCLVAEDRPLDAIDRLDSARSDHPEAFFPTLLELSQKFRSTTATRRLLEEMAEEAPSLRRLAAAGWLRQGKFEHALRLAESLPKADGEASAIGMIAAAVLGQNAYAARLQQRLDQARPSLSSARVAELWGSALSARAESTTVERPSGDTSVLAGVVTEAIHALDDDDRGLARSHRVIACGVLARLREAQTPAHPPAA